MKRVVIAILVVLVCSGTGLGAYWYFWADREDPQVAEVREMMSKMRNDGDQVSDEDRRQLREKMESLNSEQRRQLWQGGNPFTERMNRVVDEYFELPPAERVAYLDKQIDRFEERRKQFEQARQERAEREAERGTDGDGDRSSGTGSSSSGPAAGKGSGGRGNSVERKFRSRMRRLDKEGQKERQKKRLDGSSPERRAKWSEFIDAMRQRRKERGLPEWGRRRR